MKLPVLLLALAAIALTVASTWLALAQTHRTREPIAYYTGWGGYAHPVVLSNRISREKADALAAEGAAIMIGEYNEEGQLVRVTRMLRGEAVFTYTYSYHANGRLKTARIARDGQESVLEYDARGRAAKGQGPAL